MHGATTGSDGVATLTFNEEGIYRLKADRSDAVRSNTLIVCADPAGAAPCTLERQHRAHRRVRASERPTPSCRAGGWQAATGARAPSWSRGVPQDGAGSGVAHYSVEVSEANDGAGASQAEPEWRTLLDKAPTNSLHFRGESGDAYRFRITATDRALNSASIVTDPVLIPVDDRDRKLLRLSRGWKRTRALGAPGAARSCARRGPARPRACASAAVRSR